MLGNLINFFPILSGKIPTSFEKCISPDSVGGPPENGHFLKIVLKKSMVASNFLDNFIRNSFIFLGFIEKFVEILSL